MNAIDYVVRDSAGALQRGVISAEGQTTILAGAGQEISLNLREPDLQSQTRVGDDLTIVLADGRVIVIENYFNDIGAPNRLFVSADGYLNEVTFVETTDGELFAQFGPSEQWGKWSPDDDLIFLGRTDIAMIPPTDDDVSMLGAALLGGTGLIGAGAAAVAGVAVVAGGGGEGEPTSDTAVAPTVNDPEATSNVGGDDTATHTVGVSGTGVPGDTVNVTVGETVVTTTVGEDGTWTTVFQGDTFPPDGIYESVATVTHSDGTTTTLDGPGFNIDTVPPQVAIADGGVVNAAVMDQGVVVSGTGEVGASIQVTVAGVVRATTVDDNGNWSVSYQAGTLAPGEYSSEITVVSGDAHGNTSTTTSTLVVDTINDVTINTSTVETDGIINAAEAADGVQLTGTAEAGSSVAVTFGAVTQTVTAAADGTWSADFAANAVPAGESTVTVTAVATDGQGNTSNASGTVEVDTLVNALSYTSTSGGADGIINQAEAQNGLVVTGMVEPGSTVMIELNGATTQATVAADGSWTATFAAGQIQSGTYNAVMTATATDAAGNTDTVTQNVSVDTDAGTLTISPNPIEGDDIINFNEAADGVVLSGTADAGAVVDVTLGAVTHTVVTGANGAWQSTFTATEVPQGVYTANITATTTDAAGNTLTRTDSVQVDTRVDNLAVQANLIEGDNTISGAEMADGVVVTGTTEPGSSVSVTLANATTQAVVDAQGNWTASYAAGQIQGGEYQTQVTVTATDAAGNVATVSDTVDIDTLVNTLNQQGNIETDNIVNAAEAQDGMSLGGQVETGSTVVVSFGGQTYPAIVDAAGNWTVDIPAGAITAGTYDAAIGVTATDAVGNVDTINSTVRVDTDAPEGPIVASVTDAVNGYRGISTVSTDDTLEISQVGANGAISQVGFTQSENLARGETDVTFNANVPDGSHLVITATDDAGNVSGTYVVLDDQSANSTVDLSNPALGGYSINQVELQFAEEANLSINEAQLVALSSTSDTLTVHGGTDDDVTITGAALTGGAAVGGQTYDVYSVGNDGTLIVDDDITTVIA